jgi:hypothetical protein
LAETTTETAPGFASTADLALCDSHFNLGPTPDLRAAEECRYSITSCCSGNPALRKPSIISFVFIDSRLRAIHADIVKAGSNSSTPAAALRAFSVPSEMGESGREAAVWSWIGRVLTQGFLPCNDGLVEATKLNKGKSHPS